MNIYNIKRYKPLKENIINWNLSKDCLNILIKSTEVWNPLEIFNEIDIERERDAEMRTFIISRTSTVIQIQLNRYS